MTDNAGVVAHRVNSPRAVREDRRAGDFCYTGEGAGFPGGIVLCCPCGCGDISGIAISTDVAAAATGGAWHWDGNREKPTLSPSLHKLSAELAPGRPSSCGWHGWLRAGVFERV